jgi:phosphopantothenoylcysteine decarboxylase/phosphopantothenate--cysteine ligase
MPTVLLGISGGIAAFKMLEVIQLLKQEGVSIHVLITRSATQMIDPQKFAVATGNKVWTKLFENDFEYQKTLQTRVVDHIQLADSADLMVIAPATANTIAKLAHGLADDFLTTTTLAVTAPVIICPSMNVHMWQHPATQANILKLKNLGYQVIHPDSGPLACGYEGQGRLVDVKTLKKEVLRQLQKMTTLKGKTVVITAGGTIERIDDVRAITNKSSGKMGAALADSCAQRGARVILLRASSAVEPRALVEQECFETADDLQKLLQKCTAKADFIFHTAAVADFSVQEPVHGKIKSDKPHALTLNPRPKIINLLKKLNPNAKLIAFKTDYKLSKKELQKAVDQKFADTHADAIIANDISLPDRGFQSDTNEVEIFLPGQKPYKIHLTTKKEVAEQIIDFFEERIF